MNEKLIKSALKNLTDIASRNESIDDIFKPSPAGCLRRSEIGFTYRGSIIIFTY